MDTTGGQLSCEVRHEDNIYQYIYRDINLSSKKVKMTLGLEGVIY